MIALLIAMVAAVSLLWAPAVGAHSVKPAPAAVTALAPVAAVAPASGLEPSPPGETDRGLLVLAVLAAGIVGASLTRRLRKPVLALAAAGLLVALLATSAPHLVHHAFEPGKAAECQTLQIANHADGTVGDPGMPPVVVVSFRVVPDHRLPVVTASAPTTRSRAPPA
ncbi:MAG TPA: hypothetical protein VIG07_11380 [Methylomirabilota bacterium]|jgi:hypothetical protein